MEPVSQDEVLVLAGLTGAVGLGLVALSLLKPAGGGGQLKPGETMGPVQASLPAGQITLSISASTPLQISNPTVLYSGPGRNTYFYAQIKQGNVTVYGSGIAGVFVGPASSPTSFPLVSPTQIQPCGGVGQVVDLIPWSAVYEPCGVANTPICGAPPVVGNGDLYLQVYQDQAESGNSADANGFSSPTCNPTRQALAMVSVVYSGKILFVA